MGRVRHYIWCGAMIHRKFVKWDQYFTKNEKSQDCFVFCCVSPGFSGVRKCSTSSPSGNLVDGSPLVAHKTGEDACAPAPRS